MSTIIQTPPPLYRMVFNSIADSILDYYRDGKMSKQEALTRINGALEYVINEIDQERFNVPTEITLAKT